MKAIILGNNGFDLNRVYPATIVQELKQICVCDGKFYSKKDLIKEGLSFDCEAIFSTWGMPHWKEEEIRKFFPALRYVFYSAGSVQHFAKEFLACGVRVFSSWKANAVPVAEYTAAQIVLANKGYFRSARRLCPYPLGILNTMRHTGNYGAKVGLLGVGGVGSLVAQQLMGNDLEVYAYDPFLSQERAKQLHVRLAEPDWLFANCDVISNHLANKKELNDFIDYKKLKSMPKYSTFINTGRGAQVNEWALFRVLAIDKSKTAVLDVTKHEPRGPFNPLRLLGNVVVTPHIAGSTGKEVLRMSRLMLQTCSDVLHGMHSENEVTLQMLDTMA